MNCSPPHAHHSTSVRVRSRTYLFAHMRVQTYGAAAVSCVTARIPGCTGAVRRAPRARRLAVVMHKNNVSAYLVPWQLFGTSHFECQPQGPLMRNFVRRAPADWFREQQGWISQSDRKVVPISIGKPIQLWDVDCSLDCSTHKARRASARGPRVRPCLCQPEP